MHLDYAVAVGAHDLIAREVIEDPAAVRLLIAADVGPVRLIDNCAGAVAAPATSTAHVAARAGASAIFEVAYFARPMILVPYPFANAHQAENAGVFSRQGAAVVIDENTLSAETFKDNILRLFKDKEVLKKLGNSAKRLSSPDAAASLTREVLGLSER